LLHPSSLRPHPFICRPLPQAVLTCTSTILDAELPEEETEFIGQVLHLFADGQPAGVSGLRVVVQEQLIEMMRGKSANTT